jgi:hypothetical protein
VNLLPQPPAFPQQLLQLVRQDTSGRGVKVARPLRGHAGIQAIDSTGDMFLEELNGPLVIFFPPRHAADTHTTCYNTV